MKRTHLILYFAGFVFSSMSANAQAEEPVIVPEKIHDNLYVLYGGNGQGANVGVYIGKDGLLLIDAMVEKSHDKLLSAIRKISDKPVKYVIGTHSHLDHTGGNAFFAGQGAMIFLQENARYENGPAHVYFKDRLTLNMDGEKITAHAAVSHSFCDAIIYFRESNVVFMGDTHTNNWHPAAANMAGQFEAIDMALSMADENTVVVPGHGIVDNRQGLLSYKDKCGRWLARLGELYRAKLSVDEMAGDEQLNRIKESFIDAGTSITIPGDRFKRFIRRTISAELIAAYPLEDRMLSMYEGRYQYDGGVMESVVVINGKLYMRKQIPSAFMAELIPLSETRFHIRGGLEEYVLFSFNEEGAVRGLTFVEGDKRSVAERVDGE